MRVAIAILAIAACGDNLPPSADAPTRDASARCAPKPGRVLALERIAGGCGQPETPTGVECMNGTVTLVTSPPGDPRLFALELAGQIRLFVDGALLHDAFLDVTTDPAFVSGGEQGLLGLAFHPDYAHNGRLFVFYTAQSSDRTDTVHPYVDELFEYAVDPANPARARAESRRLILSIPDGFPNHNGGMIEFGADGDLYLGTGDGGSDPSLPADPFGNGQNAQALLGKILRIDVDHPSGANAYGIPADNPYAAGGGAPEVWMRGLRNPWRWSFDRPTGDLWIADVGAATVEEIDVLHPNQQRGSNLGWNVWEGHACFAPPCGDPFGFVFPQLEHSHADGFAAIIGGGVYRGDCFPDLRGTYVYTDLNEQHLHTAHLQSDGSLPVEPASAFIGLPTSVHAASDGELYATSYNGDIFHIVAGE